jgi:hypothetical protein
VEHVGILDAGEGLSGLVHLLPQTADLLVLCRYCPSGLRPCHPMQSLESLLPLLTSEVVLQTVLSTLNNTVPRQTLRALYFGEVGRRHPLCLRSIFPAPQFL